MQTATEVRERPILFSGPMVRAILDGRKTQTRRVVRLPRGLLHDDVEYKSAFWNSWTGTHHHWQCGDDRISPNYQVGSRLWVREKWGMAATACGGEEVVYAADYPDGSDIAAGVRHRQSIHMRRRDSRITLEITDVRVQRVQEITEEDAIAEGSQCAGVPASLTNRGAFAKLWNSINGKKPKWRYAALGEWGYPDRKIRDGFDTSSSWEANPWVWCISFRRLETT